MKRACLLGCYVFHAACMAAPSQPPISGVVSGIGHAISVVGDSSCIVDISTPGITRGDHVILSGTLTTTELQLTDQFGTRMHWSITWNGDRGSLVGGQLTDSFSGPCQLREHYTDQQMTITRTGRHLDGIGVYRYELRTVDDQDTGMRGTDTSVFSFEVQ